MRQDHQNEFASFAAGKTSNLDGNTTGKMKHLDDPKARHWLLLVYNKCLKTAIVPTTWKITKVILYTPENISRYPPFAIYTNYMIFFARHISNGQATANTRSNWLHQAGFRLITMKMGMKPLINYRNHFCRHVSKLQVLSNQPPRPALYHLAGIAPMKK